MNEICELYKLLKKDKVVSDISLQETEVNKEFLKTVMQACQELDDATKDAVSDAITYAMIHSQDDDFIKQYGTTVSNVLLGQQVSEDLKSKSKDSNSEDPNSEDPTQDGILKHIERLIKEIKRGIYKEDTYIVSKCFKEISKYAKSAIDL